MQSEKWRTLYETWNWFLWTAKFYCCENRMMNTWSRPFLFAWCILHENVLESFLMLTLTVILSLQISFIDSWLLSRNPMKKLLLRVMRKPKPNDREDILQRQITYSFGDHYEFRKELKILNLLTGYKSVSFLPNHSFMLVSQMNSNIWREDILQVHLFARQIR